MMETIKTAKDFSDKIQEDGLRIMKFFGDWCAPCKALTAVIETIEGSYDDVFFYEVNVDDIDEEVIEKYSIQSVPVLLFFKNGELVKELLGLVNVTKLKEIIEDVK